MVAEKDGMKWRSEESIKCASRESVVWKVEEL